MSVKVIKNRVFDGTETYEVGDVIEGLSEKDESQLVSEGIVEYKMIHEEKTQRIDPKVNTEIPNADEPLVDSNIEEDYKEEGQVEMIDPNSFNLNADEYLNTPTSPAKKKK